MRTGATFMAAPSRTIAHATRPYHIPDVDVSFGRVLGYSDSAFYFSAKIRQHTEALHLTVWGFSHTP